MPSKFGVVVPDEDIVPFTHFLGSIVKGQMDGEDIAKLPQNNN